MYSFGEKGALLPEGAIRSFDKAMRSHRSTGVSRCLKKNPLRFPVHRGNAQSHTTKACYVPMTKVQILFGK